VVLTGTATASAAIKPGAKCVKAGSKVLKDSVSLTCKKNGKKLIWVKTDSTSSPAAPQTLPTPKPSSSSPTEVRRADSLRNLDANVAMRYVMQEFLVFAKPTGLRANLEIIKAPNVSQEIFDLFKPALLSGSDFFLDRFVSNETRKFFIGNEKDVDFIAEQAAKLGDRQLGIRLKNESEVAGKYFTSASAGKNIGVIVFHSSYSVEFLRYPYSDLAVHEFSHMYQFDKTPVGIGTGWEVFGCLWLEGHAEFIAQYRVWQKESDLEAFRKYYFVRNLVRDNNLNLNTREKIIKYLVESEDVNKSKCRGMYSIGTIVIEGLVAVHGLEKMHEFYEEIYKGNKAREAFPKVFGTTVDQFYADVADYVLLIQKKYGVI